MTRERTTRHPKHEQTAFADIEEFVTRTTEEDRQQRRLDEATAFAEECDADGPLEREDHDEPIAVAGLRVASVWMSESDYQTLSILRRLSGEPESVTLEQIVQTGLEMHLHEERRRLRGFDLEKLESKHGTTRQLDASTSQPPRAVTMEIGISREEYDYIEALATISGHSPRETVEAIVSRGLADLTERLEWTISRVYEAPANTSRESRRASIEGVNATVRSTRRRDKEGLDETS